jgi:hypothetical protein
MNDDLNRSTHDAWEANAETWDVRMGDEEKWMMKVRSKLFAL